MNRKKILGFLAGLLIAGVALAGGIPLLVEDNYSGVTNTATYTGAEGWLESVYVDVAASSTQTVTIASANETILTLTSLAADGMYRPRLTTHGNTGVAVAVNTNDFVRAYLDGETITVTVVASSAATNDVTVRLSISK